MEDEVCDGVLEDVHKTNLSCNDFASKKKLIETDQLSFLTKMLKQSRNMLRSFSGSWYETDRQGIEKIPNFSDSMIDIFTKILSRET
jgi:hypothetical protein